MEQPVEQTMTMEEYNAAVIEQQEGEQEEAVGTVFVSEDGTILNNEQLHSQFVECIGALDMERKNNAMLQETVQELKAQMQAMGQQFQQGGRKQKGMAKVISHDVEPAVEAESIKTIKLKKEKKCTEEKPIEVPPTEEAITIEATPATSSQQVIVSDLITAAEVMDVVSSTTQQPQEQTVVLESQAYGDDVYLQVGDYTGAENTISSSPTAPHGQQEVVGGMQALTHEIVGMKIIPKRPEEQDTRENVCRICLKAFANKMCLRQHRWVHMDYKPFTCSTCGKGLKSKQAYLRHKEMHKRPKTPLRQKTEILSMFVIPVRDEQGNVQCWRCAKCHRTFAERKLCSRHVDRHMVKERNGPKKRKCSRCKDLRFDNVNQLRAHNRTVHHGKSLLICNVCDKGCANESALLLHMASHSEEKIEYACADCGKLFTHPGRLRKHQRVHIQQRLYLCMICHHDFKCDSDLGNHMRRHNVIKVYNCKQCNKRFRRRYRLKGHERTVHAGFTYNEGSDTDVGWDDYFSGSEDESEGLKCYICQKRFMVRRYLNDHLKKHLDTIVPERKPSMALLAESIEQEELMMTDQDLEEAVAEQKLMQQLATQPVVQIERMISEANDSDCVFEIIQPSAADSPVAAPKTPKVTLLSPDDKVINVPRVRGDVEDIYEPQDMDVTPVIKKEIPKVMRRITTIPARSSLKAEADPAITTDSTPQKVTFLGLRSLRNSEQKVPQPRAVNVLPVIPLQRTRTPAPVIAPVIASPKKAAPNLEAQMSPIKSDHNIANKTTPKKIVAEPIVVAPQDIAPAPVTVTTTKRPLKASILHKDVKCVVCGLEFKQTSELKKHTLLNRKCYTPENLKQVTIKLPSMAILSKRK